MQTLPSFIFCKRVDLTSYNDRRKQKYSMRKVFKQLDLGTTQQSLKLMFIDKNGSVNVDVFLAVAQDHDIELSQKDQTYMKQKLAFGNKVVYEDLIKDLALVFITDNPKAQTTQTATETTTTANTKPLMLWVLRSNNKELITSLKASQSTIGFNLVKVKNKTSLMQTRLKLLSKNESMSVKLGSQQNSGHAQTPSSKASQPPDLQPHNQDQINDILNAFTPELQAVVKKIIGSRVQVKKGGFIDWTKHISAASKKINIPKNIQNKIFIKAAISSDKVQQQKDRIRRYMKENNVDIMHLNAINSVFLDCDQERTGSITKKEFLMQIAEQNLQFPFDFLFNLMSDMQENADDQSEEAILSYENLKNIIEIYNNCPTFLRGDANNSDNFRSNMDTNKDLTVSHDKVDKLFQYVHARIEEKFKDFRQAFRSFDKNFDGGLNFKEFITGMESIGVKLKLTDYKLIFDHVDYDGEGEIGFSKFCLLNTDRKQDLQKLKAEHLKQQQEQKSLLGIQGKKPPLPPLSAKNSVSENSTKGHPLFGDGNIPKNKDMNSFTLDIQSKSAVQSYMEEKFNRTAQSLGFKTFQDFPETHVYGKKVPREHNMVALLTNQYQDDLNKITVDSLRQQLSHKRIPVAKPTYAQMMREKMIRSKYNSRSLLSSSNSVPSIPRSNSASKRIKRQDFILKCSNSLSNSLNRSLTTQTKL